MNAEHEKELETNSLADWLGRTWTRFKQGKLISYPVMALLLLLVAGVILFVYIRSAQASAESQAWVALEGANTDGALEDLARRYPDSTVGRVAEFHRARNLLGPEGIDRLVTRDEAERKKALANIDTARDQMTKLAEAFGDREPALRAECYLGLVKAEAALIGINKAGASDEYRGSVDRLTEYLDKLAKAAEGTPWGDEAAKLSEKLRAADPKAREELVAVQRSLYNTALLPGPPGTGPLPPAGDLPGLGGIPGFPGPAAPPSNAPAVTP
ncbi:MAG: hypothetical protein K2X87_05030, partial [Gemmataceae bacterium]|nr:hypothetical protein [Gemmataceae bacterium]